MKLIIHTDGGSRGNPGNAAIGIVIEGWEAPITIGKRIGIKTNNEAEYEAVIMALKELVQKKGKEGLERIEEVEFVLDSLLVVSQINGSYKVKQAHLQSLLAQVKAHIDALGIPVHFRHVLRTENREADRLVNEALDSG